MNGGDEDCQRPNMENPQKRKRNGAPEKLNTYKEKED